jgi:hypothetical protein
MAAQPDAGHGLKIPSYTTTPVDQIPVVRRHKHISPFVAQNYFADSSQSKECVQDWQNKVYSVPQATAPFARVPCQG